MSNASLIERIKQAIRDIFKKNNNTPLLTEELVPLVDKKIGNGEINEGLTVAAIETMLDRFELVQLPNTKLELAQHS